MYNTKGVRRNYVEYYVANSVTIVSPECRGYRRLHYCRCVVRAGGFFYSFFVGVNDTREEPTFKNNKSYNFFVRSRFRTRRSKTIVETGTDRFQRETAP